MTKYKMLNLIWLFICVSVINQIQSQNKYTISGYVNEKGSKENLPGVTIHQARSNNATTSNVYGFYSITLPESDSVELIFLL